MQLPQKVSCAGLMGVNFSQHSSRVSKCEWGAAVIPTLYDFSISLTTLDCHNRPRQGFPLAITKNKILATFIVKYRKTIGPKEINYICLNPCLHSLYFSDSLKY